MGSLNAVAGGAVYLDANILIYAVEDTAGRGASLRPLFDRVDRGEVHAVTSELTEAEVLVKPIRDGAAALRLQYEELLDPAGPLAIAPVSRAVLIRAAELRAAHPPLKLPDAIHSATALLAGCTTS